jgi:hypothetical protein
MNRMHRREEIFFNRKNLFILSILQILSILSQS